MPTFRGTRFLIILIGQFYSYHMCNTSVIETCIILTVVSQYMLNNITVDMEFIACMQPVVLKVISTNLISESNVISTMPISLLWGAFIRVD